MKIKQAFSAIIGVNAAAQEHTNTPWLSCTGCTSDNDLELTERLNGIYQASHLKML